MKSNTSPLINETLLEEKLETLGPDICESVQFICYVAKHYPEAKINLNFITDYINKISDLEEFVGEVYEAEYKISFNIKQQAKQAIKAAEKKPIPIQNKPQTKLTPSSPDKQVLHMKYKEFLSNSYLPTLKFVQSQTPTLPKKNSK